MSEAAYFVIVHADVELDLRQMLMRQIWIDSYRAFREARPHENLSAKQILSKFSQGLYQTGTVGRLWGVRF